MWYKRFQQPGSGVETSRTVTLFKKLNWLRDIEASKQVDTEYMGYKDGFTTTGFECRNI